MILMWTSENHNPIFEKENKNLWHFFYEEVERFVCKEICFQRVIKKVWEFIVAFTQLYIFKLNEIIEMKKLFS